MLSIAEQLLHNPIVVPTIAIADYIGLCRSMIREPDLVKLWQNGDTAKATCLSDYACFGPTRQGKGPLCVHELKAVS